MNDCAIDDILGMTVTEIAKHTNRGDTLHEAIVLHDKKVVDSELPMNFIEAGIINGEHRIFKVVKAPLYDQFGVLIGTVGFGRDITTQCSAAFAILNNIESATETCPRECVYSGEINDLLIDTITLLRDIISTTCDLATRPPQEKKNGK